MIVTGILSPDLKRFPEQVFRILQQVSCEPVTGLSDRQKELLRIMKEKAERELEEARRAVEEERRLKEKEEQA